jgi:hypothetical protein
MTPRSAKQKGKNLEKKIAKIILDIFPEFVYNEDIRVTIGQEHGCDLKLSKKALELLPIKIEAKARERLETIYGFYEQAQSHEGKQEAVVVIRSNRKKALAIIDFEYLIRLFRERNKKNV